MNPKDFEYAQRIYKSYDLELPKPWRGLVAVTHAWHRGSRWFVMTYEEFVSRVIEIQLHKPKTERRERLALMKPHPEVTIPKYVSEAHSNFIWAGEGYKSLIKYQAYMKALIRWEGTKRMERVHDRTCPNCQWERFYTTYLLPQFEPFPIKPGG